MPKFELSTNRTWISFLGPPGFNRYFANTSWLIAEKIFRSVVLLVVSVYVARYLGPDRFGLLSYTISFVGLFLPVAVLGLDGIVIRELVRDGTKRNQLLGTAFFLKITGAFFVLGVLYIALHFISNDSFTNLLIFIIAASTVFQSFNVIDFYLQSKVLSKYVVYAKVASLTLWAIINLFLIWAEATLLYFAVVFLIESAALAIGLVIVYVRQKLNIFEWAPTFRLAVGLLKDSWPLVLSGLCVSIYMKIDQVMIKHMLDSEAVGQYAVAVKLSEAFYFVPVVVCSSLFPAVINAKKRSKDLYYARLQKLYGLMVWTALPMTLVITFLASNIVQFLYGIEFSKGGSVLAIHIWATPFVFLGVASSKWFLSENLQLYSFVYQALGAVMNITLNFILIKHVGITGAAWATVISYACVAYFLNFVCPKTRSHFYRLSEAFNILRTPRKLIYGFRE